MIEKERDVQAQGEPLLGAQEHDAEEAVDGVFWQHQLKREQRHEPASEGGTVTPTVLLTQRPSLPQKSHYPETLIHFRSVLLFLDPRFRTQALRTHLTRTGHLLLAVTHA